MTPLDAALGYAARGWPVFPCEWRNGERWKRPLLEHGLHAASSNAETIGAWWDRWPNALIGVPTGERIRAVVLDIDRKNGIDGLATFGHLDCPILPATPTVCTPTGGGLHLYFARPDGGLRNSNGGRGRGIGPGLDWRGDGGYVLVPGSGGYRWDRWTFDNCKPVPVPPTLVPREPERSTSTRPLRPTTGLSPYGEAALDSACRRIIAAPAGQQESTLNGECFGIGTLAGAGVVPVDFARRVLLWAGRQMRDYDRLRPWRRHEIEIKVNRAFDDGMRRPREARRA